MPIPLTEDFVLIPLISLPFFMLPCALLNVADIGIPSSAKWFDERFVLTKAGCLSIEALIVSFSSKIVVLWTSKPWLGLGVALRSLLLYFCSSSSPSGLVSETCSLSYFFCVDLALISCWALGDRMRYAFCRLLFLSDLGGRSPTCSGMFSACSSTGSIFWLWVVCRFRSSTALPPEPSVNGD